MQNDLSFDEFDGGLVEIHTHIGSCLTPSVLWKMAKSQEIELPVNNYDQFKNAVTIVNPRNYEEYVDLFKIIELIQSTPISMEIAVKHIIEKAYKASNVQMIELRFNPVFRCRSGRADVNEIIESSIRGLNKAMDRYPVKAGLIFCMDRRLSPENNKMIAMKAVEYSDKGVVGLDLAGPVKFNDKSREFKPSSIKRAVQIAREANLGITIHTGEVTGSGALTLDKTAIRAG